MKGAKLNDLKGELKLKTVQELHDIVLRMAKHKIENKELLSYLLFEADDELGYVHYLKECVDEKLLQMEGESLYRCYKMLRKLQRDISKWCKYSGKSTTTLELNLYFVQQMEESGMSHASNGLINMCEKQKEKVRKMWDKMDEELKNDYRTEINNL